MAVKRSGVGSKLEGETDLERKLVENLVELQKVHTNLAERFDKLSNQISDLLSLFEMTARSFAGNPANQTNQKDREFLEKVDKLLEQNKTIAKGLSMMEERIRNRAPLVEQKGEEFQPSLTANTKPLPHF